MNCRMNAFLLPVFRLSARMSGVFGHRFGRKKSGTSPVVNSVKYCSNSAFELRQVKYVYDCVKPSLKSLYMTFGLVNASARKITSGYACFTSAIIHSQKGNALV